MGPAHRIDHRSGRADHTAAAIGFLGALDFGRELRAEPLEEADETKILTNLSDALRAHRDRLQLAIRQSVFLGLTGLGTAALGYVLAKMFFG